MKSIFFRVFFLVAFMSILASASSYAIEVTVQVEPNVQQFLKTLNLQFSHVSTESSTGCKVTRIFDEWQKVFISKVRLNTDGGSVTIPTSIKKCKAKLNSIYFDGRQNRRMVESHNGNTAGKEMKRVDIILAPGSQNDTVFVGCKLLDLYVAGSDEKRSTLSCSLDEKSYFDPQLEKINIVFQLKN